MFGNQNLMRNFIIWALLTLFITITLLGIVSATNYNKIAENQSKISDISDQTCGNVGGRWVETTYQFICVVDKEWNQ